MTTEFLTFDEGISILIQTAFFLLFYVFYYLIFEKNMPKNMPMVNIFFTTLIFSMWLFSVTIFSNITLALTVPIPRFSSIPFGNKSFTY